MSKPTKRIMNALEKVFAAEIEGRLPFESKAKVYLELCDEGYLEPVQRRFGTGPLSAVVSGFQLTHRGRYTYCSNCEGEDDN